MSSRQLTHIETDFLTKGLTFQLLKILPNKDIIATIEDAVKGSRKRKAWHNSYQNIPYTAKFQTPPKNNLAKDQHKDLKELQSDTLIVIFPADKGRSTVILNRKDYLGKCMDHRNNGPYKLLKKYPPSKIKAKTLKQYRLWNWL